MKRKCTICSSIKECKYSGPTCSSCYRKQRKELDQEIEQYKQKAPWELTRTQYQEIKEKPCFFCGHPSAKIVRMDREEGYTLKNTMACCNKCNRVRSGELTPAETKAIAESLYKKNYDEVYKIFEYDLETSARRIYISDDINHESCERIIKGLHILENMSNDNITIIMNSPGGEWYSGMAVYDTITNCHCFVTIQVFGQASSMGSIILQAADLRVMAPNSIMMLHEGESGFYGSVQDFKSAADEENRILDVMYKIYMDRAQKPRDEIAELCKKDTYLTARKAVEIGLADEILGRD